MPSYSLDQLERHWRWTSRSFDREYADCIAMFRELFRSASSLASALTSRKTLEPNCAFVLLAKMLNHVSASFALLQRGLLIDAALTTRNAMETGLLLELLCKEPSECESWSAGKTFRPSDVRKRLAALPSVTIGELIVEISADEYDDARFAYDWMSRISHANVESYGHMARKRKADQIELTIGGSLSRPEIIALTKIIGSCCLRALLVGGAAHAPELLHRKVFDELAKRVHAVKAEAGA
jgi:non-ribosomal peptide synthetase component E (peptide arylation enzyme)